jgi:hypothetical protein
MSERKLVLSLAALLIIGGVLLALFSPGGFLNNPVPFGSLNAPVVDGDGDPVFDPAQRPPTESTVGPIMGYTALGLGALSIVVGLAMTPRPKT